MSIHKNYAVFGLGSYGRAVAQELIDSGASVIAVDCDAKLVEDLVGSFPICKCADVTDAEVIAKLGIAEIDTVIIALADCFEASVMATMLCKEAGVGQVIVKCRDSMHRAILEKVGADMVVYPEQESGVRLAKNLLSAGFVDIADISEEISIAEIRVRPEWVGKSLLELELRRKYAINVIALRDDSAISIAVQPDTVLAEQMRLVVIANKEDISKLQK